MKDSVEAKPAQIGKGRFSGHAWIIPTGAGLFCFIFSVFLLLSGCDVIGGSISKFIDYNTGDARVVDFKITTETPACPIIKTSKAWLHSPNANLARLGPNIIEFEAKIDNPEHYDLMITPVLYEFIGASESSAAPAILHNQISEDTVRIQIGTSETPVSQGDSFRIRLDIATKDGTRVFSPYKDIPQIIYDNALKSPSVANIVATSNPNYSKKLEWKIQLPSEHVGINRIYINLSSTINESFQRKWEYKKVSDVSWVMDKGTPDVQNTLYENLTAVYEADGIKFELPFPILSDNSEDIDFFEDYSFMITLQDKNGLTATSGEGVSTETTLKGLTVGYHYRNSPDTVYVDSGWEFINKNRENFFFTVPYDVDRVQFSATINDEVFGEQQVRWPYSLFNEPQKNYQLYVVGSDLTQYVNVFTMSVNYWENPKHGPNDEPDLKKQYKFNITRTNPKRDSTLKNIFIQDFTAGSPGVKFPVFDGSEDPALLNDMNYDGPVKTNYTVHVPYTVSKIRLLCDFLNVSVAYNEAGSTTGKAGLGSPYPSTIKTLTDDENYSGDDYYITPSQLKIIEDGWIYNLTSPGDHFFEINVRPEFANDETYTRHYVINVIRTDPAGNPNAKLENLTVKAGGTTYLAPGLNFNSFNSDLLSYTVNVPSSVNSVDIGAEAIKESGIYKAEIRRITSINIDSGIGDEISQPPASILSPPLTINLAGVGIKKLVTITVYSKDENSTSKDYTITLIKSHSTNIGGVELSGGRESLGVKWTGSDPWADIYEAWYSYYDSDSGENIPELARKWPVDFTTNAGGSILGLSDIVKYNVWVRAKDTHSNTPGDWILAKTSGLSYGIPGAAELSDLSWTPLANIIDPPLFSPSVYAYTLVVSSATGSLTFTGQPMPGNTNVPVGNGAFTTPSAGNSAVKQITAKSPDGKTSQNYDITVKRMLPAPSSPSLTPLNGSIQINSWSPVTGSGSYEVYYKKSSDPDNAIIKWGGDVSSPPNSSAPITILGLANDGTQYNVWIRAKNSATGPGDFYKSPSIIPADNCLSALSVSYGNLSPSFSPEVTTYWLDRVAPYYTESITVSATGPGVTGMGSKNLSIGQNVIEVKTNPGSGSGKTYTIYVNRDAGLEELSVVDPVHGALTLTQTQAPAVHTFNSEVTSYTVNGGVSYSTSSVNVITTPAGTMVSGAGLRPLAVGENPLDVIITQNGMQKVYTITVWRGGASTTNTLNYIKLCDGNDTQLIRYDNVSVPPISDALVLPVDNFVDRIKVYYEKSDSLAEVYVFGGENLLVGSNNITVLVVPESGMSDSKIYTIIVNRADDPGP